MGAGGHFHGPCDSNIFWGIGAVFAGGLADRFGNVKVIASGALVYVIGMALMSGVESPWMLNASAPRAPYSGRSEVSPQERSQSVPEALHEALGYRSYLLLVMGFFVCGFHVAFITAHMPAFLTDIGFDAQVGAWSIALIGLCKVAAILHWPIRERPVARLAAGKI